MSTLIALTPEAADQIAAALRPHLGITSVVAREMTPDDVIERYLTRPAPTPGATERLVDELAEDAPAPLDLKSPRPCFDCHLFHENIAIRSAYAIATGVLAPSPFVAPEQPQTHTTHTEDLIDFLTAVA